MIPSCMGGAVVDALEADFETGVLRWKERPAAHFNTKKGHAIWSSKYPGKVAGTKSTDGYIRISFTLHGMRSPLLAHRVIWFLRTQTWPVTVDHKNMVRHDNRIKNLRAATYAENNVNRPAIRNGLKGATFDKGTGLYVAQINVQGKNKFLGRFPTEEEAHFAYTRAAQTVYGEFAK